MGGQTAPVGYVARSSRPCTARLPGDVLNGQSSRACNRRFHSPPVVPSREVMRFFPRQSSRKLRSCVLLVTNPPAKFAGGLVRTNRTTLREGRRCREYAAKCATPANTCHSADHLWRCETLPRPGTNIRHSALPENSLMRSFPTLATSDTGRLGQRKDPHGPSSEGICCEIVPTIMNSR